ncbi:hypothetical protein NC652_032285 [Populus alba x Populus x berolinensis]|uniref:Uncharacterized protein n=1 Tax=Populus alba x Populus x berolinensis TaxID=444605 RepID=A0AAD6PXQ5_9ROSI|nr:hypothetical protein NC652_032285 [Populus alba x Populus x berolinensis]KAJ6971632.1 hypothetical protein NC653_032223 [Populus alba x Populus x berolinensis]
MRISSGRGTTYTEYTNQAAGVRSGATLSMFLHPRAATACRFVIGLSKSNQSAFLSALHHPALPTVKLEDTDTEPRLFSSTLGLVELPEKQL